MNDELRGWMLRAGAPLLLAASLVAAAVGGMRLVGGSGGDRAPDTRVAERVVTQTEDASSAATAVASTPLAPAATSGVATAAPTAASTAPPKRGPGAALKFDPKTAPRVPKGTSDEEYIAAYYRALAKADWKAAFALVPKNEPGETLADFRDLASAFPLKSFTILGAAPGVDAGILVVHVTPTDGVWNTVWRFADTKAGRVVRDLTYSRPGGAGCH